MEIQLQDINFMNWFFINSRLLTIYTYGSGNRPTKTYLFEDVEEFNNKINQLKNDGLILMMK